MACFVFALFCNLVASLPSLPLACVLCSPKPNLRVPHPSQEQRSGQGPSHPRPPRPGHEPGPPPPSRGQGRREAGGHRTRTRTLFCTRPPRPVPQNLGPLAPLHRPLSSEAAHPRDPGTMTTVTRELRAPGRARTQRPPLGPSLAKLLGRGNENKQWRKGEQWWISW